MYRESSVSFCTLLWHSEGTMISQARAIWDIEELLKWKPTLKECFKDTLFIVGQVYNIESLTSSDKKSTRKERDDKRSVLLELESSDNCSVNKDRASLNVGKKQVSIANATKTIKLGQPKIKSPVSQRFKNTTRPARVRPMGSASKVTSRPIVNFPRAPVKTANSKSATSMLISGHCSSDVNSNLLSGAVRGENRGFQEDDITPLYLTCLDEEDGDGGKDVLCANCAGFNSYHVETFVKKDSCTKKMCCTNINVDPSERVVV